MEQTLVTLYGRPGCDLCAESEALVRALIARDGTNRVLSVVNIESDPALHAELLEVIPVLEVAGRRLPLALSPMQIAAHLDRATSQVDGER